MAVRGAHLYVTQWPGRTTPGALVIRSTQCGVSTSVSAPAADSSPQMPKLELTPARPNPWRAVEPTARIEFSLTTNAHTRVGIYDASGRLVRQLLDRSVAAGSHTLGWDGRDEQGARVASGSYFYRLEANGKSAVRRLVVVR